MSPNWLSSAPIALRGGGQQLRRPAPAPRGASPTSDDGSSSGGGPPFQNGAVGGGRSPYGVLASQDAASTQSHVSLYSAAHSQVSLLPKQGGGAWEGAKRGNEKPYKGNGPRPGFLYDPKGDPEIDDYLHNPDRGVDQDVCSPFSTRGWLNVGALILLAGGLVALFAGYPVISYYSSHEWETKSGWNLGGVNGSGQVPAIPGLNGLIDPDTPDNAYSRTGFDGTQYSLVFSDEFNTDGRTFWPGDDPYWEAVDLHYWATNDYEWYDPGEPAAFVQLERVSRSFTDAITTQGGNLVISVTEQPTNGLDFRSGMLQSWNKFCFSGGYIEVSVSLPGSNDVPGFWPGTLSRRGRTRLRADRCCAGAWTMGNLARAGYGATTDGLWP